MREPRAIAERIAMKDAAEPGRGYGDAMAWRRVLGVLRVTLYEAIDVAQIQALPVSLPVDA